MATLKEQLAESTADNERLLGIIEQLRQVANGEIRRLNEEKRELLERLYPYMANELDARNETSTEADSS